jgi:hypothetical protein
MPGATAFNSLRREFDCEAAGEADDTALGRGVVRLSKSTEPCAGRDIDNPAVTPLDHARDDRPASQELRFQIGIDDRVPVGFLQFRETAIAHDTSIVDQYVDPAEFFRHLAKRSRDVI